MSLPEEYWTLALYAGGRATFLCQAFFWSFKRKRKNLWHRNLLIPTHQKIQTFWTSVNIYIAVQNVSAFRKLFRKQTGKLENIRFGKTTRLSLIAVKKLRGTAWARISCLTNPNVLTFGWGVEILVAVPSNFRQLGCSGRLFFAKLSFGRSKESGNDFILWK